MEIRALTAIARDEEIFVTYCPMEFAKDARLGTLRGWGFDCRCSLCIQKPTSPATSVEHRRSLCNQVHRVIGSLPSDDPGAVVGLYKRLLDLQCEEECLAWEALANAIVLADQYRKLGSHREAAECDQTAEKLGTVCYGEDFVLTEQWKADVIKAQLGL